MSAPRCQIVIPARLASTRLPEKLLRRVAGKTVLQFTYEAAMRSDVAENVVVAVDDVRIADEVESFGGRWFMTRVDHASGTDRIAEVAAAMPDVDVFVNVQGDEPEIDPAIIDRVARCLIDDANADLSTAGVPIRDAASLDDPAKVKIVMAGMNEAGQGRAVYFSRSSVPHVRDGVTADSLAVEPPLFWHHIGLYAYRRAFLNWFSGQSVSLLEATEKLEQLRAIEAGKRVVVARAEHAAPGIDTLADLEAFRIRIE
ncbi:3-deoxy-manno-octulosonate cytidylyltransferase [Rubripirellula tenax]|uniref:3-deoxy-manno-octulosonate cytidylyltransferase n=1 Tax=Rubripirellula tenax TaxID=2528015 RepID=A0A5C6ELZ7_9BACT|nr:3-deoxy-manno-octulosonate cytidylyltransferase [Rubripirellula tenax]TWU50773.1 3-deoxy-manno-octulosonate cytidylyltransferase [Rubripirellula tenax]